MRLKGFTRHPQTRTMSFVLRGRQAKGMGRWAARFKSQNRRHEKLARGNIKTSNNNICAPPSGAATLLELAQLMTRRCRSAAAGARSESTTAIAVAGALMAAHKA